MTSRRPTLAHLKLPQGQHAGLLLDKYLADQVRADTGGVQIQRLELLRAVAGLAEPALYAPFFARWQAGLERLTVDDPVYAQVVKIQPFATAGRLVVGLGQESVLETGITLHHTYGVPVIPGSALKGVAAFSAAEQGTEWALGSEAYQTLFGGPASRGYVTFFDALYIPDSGKPHGPLALDVLTVHHPEYNGGADTPPGDWDDPNPVAFLSVTGQFLVALAGPPDWVERAWTFLVQGLDGFGVGARTSSDYGKLRPVGGLAAGHDALPVQTESYAARARAYLQAAPGAGRVRGQVLRVQGRFGFVRSGGGGKYIFVHQNHLPEADRPLRAGQIVEFTIGPGQQAGQLQATQVVVLLQPD